MAKKDTPAAGDPQAQQDPAADPAADQQAADQPAEDQADEQVADTEAEADAAGVEDPAPAPFNYILNQVNGLLDQARLSVEAAHRTRDPSHTASAVGNLVDALKLMVARVPS